MHRFHSPVSWTPTHRRHFAGELLSVNPAIVRFIPGLFCLNERVVYVGHWEYGFFSLTAVGNTITLNNRIASLLKTVFLLGATNVGSVRIYCDKTLQTNHRKKKSPLIDDKFLGNAITLQKGDPFGEFRMGSTIVLVFEAPPNFRFSLMPGQKIKMGEALGYFATPTFVEKVDRSMPKNKSIRGAN